MKSFRAYVPTDIVFGSGVVKELHNHKLPGRKAMIVISNAPTAILTRWRASCGRPEWKRWCSTV